MSLGALSYQMLQILLNLLENRNEYEPGSSELSDASNLIEFIRIVANMSLGALSCQMLQILLNLLENRIE